MKNVIILESVGACIGIDGDIKGCIFPLNCDGTPDFMITNHIDDCDKEFFNSLSDEDNKTIMEIMHHGKS